MRILLVTSSLPWPTHGGGNQRTNLLYRSLRARGDVDTVMISRYGKVAPEKWRAVEDDFGGQFVFEERLTEHQAPWRWARSLSPSLPHRLTHTLWGWGCDFGPDRMVATRLRRLVEQQDYDLIVGRYMWALARSGVMRMRPGLPLTALELPMFQSGPPGWVRGPRLRVVSAFSSLEKATAE